MSVDCTQRNVFDDYESSHFIPHPRLGHHEMLNRSNAVNFFDFFVFDWLGERDSNKHNYDKLKTIYGT